MNSILLAREVYTLPRGSNHTAVTEEKGQRRPSLSVSVSPLFCFFACTVVRGFISSVHTGYAREGFRGGGDWYKRIGVYCGVIVQIIGSHYLNDLDPSEADLLIFSTILRADLRAHIAGWDPYNLP